MASQAPVKIIFVPFAKPTDFYAAGILFPILGIITVLLRFYVRSSRKSSLSFDDWLVLPALFFVIGMGACLIAAVRKHGFGYPTPPPSEPTMEAFLNDHNPQITATKQIEYSMNILMILAYGFIKLSILFFYRRLFVVDRGLFNFLTWGMIAVIISWTTTFVFMFTFGCGGEHIKAYWGSLQDIITYCGNGLLYEKALYISEFLTNVLLLVMPLPIIWRLYMPWGKKLAITGILLLAFMALIASIIRLAIVLQVASTSYTTHFDEDQTIGTIYYWGMIEAGLALVACSLPSLRALVSDQGLQTAINSFRSILSLNSGINRSSNLNKNSSLTPTGSGASERPYSKMDPDTADLTPLRGGYVMEMDNDISFVESTAKRHDPGSIRVQKDVTMRDNVA